MSENDMDRFFPVCVKAGLEPLIETHSEEEIAHANRLRAGLIGINNRNIRQWELDNGDVSRTKKLVGLVHEDAVIVSESSIMTHDDVLAALKAGAHAVLIGTALLQADDIIEKMKELRGAK